MTIYTPQALTASGIFYINKYIVIVAAFILATAFSSSNPFLSIIQLDIYALKYLLYFNI